MRVARARVFGHGPRAAPWATGESDGDTIFKQAGGRPFEPSKPPKAWNSLMRRRGPGRQRIFTATCPSTFSAAWTFKRTGRPLGFESGFVESVPQDGEVRLCGLKWLHISETRIPASSGNGFLPLPRSRMSPGQILNGCPNPIININGDRPFPEWGIPRSGALVRFLPPLATVTPLLSLKAVDYKPRRL